MEAENLSQAIENEREEQIKNLEEQLSKAEENALNNKNAAEILTDLIEKGKVVQQTDGSFNVPNGPNEIGNEHELFQ